MDVNSLTKEVQTNNLSVNKPNTSDIKKKTSNLGSLTVLRIWD